MIWIGGWFPVNVATPDSVRATRRRMRNTHGGGLRGRPFAAGPRNGLRAVLVERAAADPCPAIPSVMTEGPLPLCDIAGTAGKKAPRS